MMKTHEEVLPATSIWTHWVSPSGHVLRRHALHLLWRHAPVEDSARRPLHGKRDMID